MFRVKIGNLHKGAKGTYTGIEFDYDTVEEAVAGTTELLTRGYEFKVTNL